jgi:hypothetical protein
MLRPALALGLAAAAFGCMTPTSPMQRLSDSAYDMNTAMRFGRMDIAADHVAPKAAQEFRKNHEAWGKRLRVVDLEFSGMEIKKKGEASVGVAVSWVKLDDATLHVTEIEQRWQEDGDTWRVVEETRRSGDEGLLAETSKTPVQAAAAAPRSSFQTHVIYEQ